MAAYQATEGQKLPASILMASHYSPTAKGRCAEGQHQHTQAHLHQLQLQRQYATQQFLDGSNPSASVSAIHQRSGQLIDLVITQNPSCPAFASQLVDRVMADDEALADLMQNGGCDV